MKLKDTYIDLVGAFDCTIENNVILCTGLYLESSPPHDTANLFMFTIIDPVFGFVKEGVVVVFRELEGKIEFRYKKEVFDVVSITFDLITLSRDGIDYFIKRRNNILD